MHQLLWKNNNITFLFFCLERPFNAVYFISSFSENCQPLGSFRCFYIFKQLNLHYFVKYKSLPSMMCSALLPLEKRFPKPLYIPYEVNVLGWYAENPSDHVHGTKRSILASCSYQTSERMVSWKLKS